MVNYREIIESRYNRENWQMLLHDIFGQKVQFYQQPQQVPVDESMAKQALYTGKITLPDGHLIAIYEVELSDSVVIERNRAGIRNLLCTSWRSMGCAGAFMFCFRKNEAVLRFSYVSEAFAFTDDGALKKETTDTKRFTYLLGEGHRSRTAIEQFVKLKASGLTLKDITKAFSVEALSDLFFKEYKKHYEDIIEYITGKRMVKVSNKWVEQVTGEPCVAIMQEFAQFTDAEKAVRDYVKKLMGRLVFIQFLQKKGWMGCSAGKDWNDGDKEFVQNLFANTEYKNTFVDDVLEPLFDDINTKRDGDIANAVLGTGIKVPYLNGGLFEHDDYDDTAFPLPAKYMKSLLDFFSSYNFTIDENDPDDAEIGVDPEMLGRIFENLLEDNKDKGAFYTPKEIVQYMCRESLIAYLQTDVEDEAIKDALRQFVLTNDATCLNGAQSELAEKVDQMLQNVKICDPAIGSGAFPMGLMKELFLCRSAIEGFEGKKAADIKKHIIQNNIYGVDIEKGAVDIARLRFWLSLIIDEETPHALPNLDFKIMQGNSLLEQYKGINLAGISKGQVLGTKKKSKKKGSDNSAQLAIAFGTEDVMSNLRKNIEAYYKADCHEKKQELRNSINSDVHDFISRSVNDNPEIVSELKNLPLENDQFFLWHTWFSEVFDKGGFDIVIGNPPYIDAKKLKKIAPKLKQYTIYNGSADIYTYFYELGINICKEIGVVCLITSNKWMRSEYGKNLRKLILDNTLCQLLDFGTNRLFNATVDTNILLLMRSNDNSLETPIICSMQECLHRGAIYDYAQDNKVEVHLTEESWLIKKGDKDLVKEKLDNIHTVLSDQKINIYRGLITGCNDAYHLNDEERNLLIAKDPNNDAIIQPLVRGVDTDRFSFHYKSLWIINVHNGIKKENVPAIDIKDYPSIKERLDGFYPRLEKRDDQGVTPYNLRNCAYLSELNKEKIFWQSVSKRVAFSYDNEGKYTCDVTTFFMTGENLKYILALLNSRLFEYALIHIYLEGDTFKSKNKIIQNFPVPKITMCEQRPIITLVDRILSAKKSNPQADTTALEREIDRLVYDLYGLTEEEIKIVEGANQ